jgi:DnaJ-class molecular chaperone
MNRKSQRKLHAMKHEYEAHRNNMCKTCNGMGIIRDSRQPSSLPVPPHMMKYPPKVCSNCNGTGKN